MGTGSTQRIAFVHHKGGTGKTTSCLNVAGWLAKMKKQVLVVDLDPQGNATAGLGVDRASLDSSIYDVLYAQKPVEEVILETDSGVYLAPSSLDLLAAETHLSGQVNQTRLLKNALESVKNSFDCILVDVPPGSTLLMINGLVASENIVIPLDAGVFAYETMDTLKTLILDLREELGVEVNVKMVLIRNYSFSIFDGGLAREIRRMTAQFMTASGIPSVPIRPIPFSRKVFQAQMRGKPISHYAPFSDVGRVYRRITHELLKDRES